MTKRGPETSLDRRDWSYGAGRIQVQRRRPVLMPCGDDARIHPDSRLGELSFEASWDHVRGLVAPEIARERLRRAISGARDPPAGTDTNSDHTGWCSLIAQWCCRTASCFVRPFSRRQVPSHTQGILISFPGRSLGPKAGRGVGGVPPACGLGAGR